MTLAEFRKLTENLPGDTLLCEMDTDMSALYMPSHRFVVDGCFIKFIPARTQSILEEQGLLPQIEFYDK